MKIATFRAICKNDHFFDVPALSDHSYGEFIYFSIDGKEIRYYLTLDCNTWDYIAEKVSDYFDKKNRKEIGPIIQKIIGFVADRQNPDNFFTLYAYCPICHSKAKTIDFENRTGTKEYENLTFNGFSSLTASEKNTLITKYMMEVYNN